MEMQLQPVVLVASLCHLTPWDAPAHAVKPTAAPVPAPALVRLPLLENAPLRPQHRRDCLPGGTNSVRPCPWVSCRHHLLLNCEGERIEELAQEVTELPHTCSLDVAEITDETGRSVILSQLEPYFGVTRERIRQLELRSVQKLLAGLGRGGFTPQEMARLFEKYLEIRDTPQPPKRPVDD